MNIKKMLEAQKKLDEANLKKGGIEEYPIEEVKTAYRVELGELLQEWKGFKYWKLSKGEIDREKLLEEWADCCHFALSLENKEHDDYKIKKFIKEVKITNAKNSRAIKSIIKFKFTSSKSGYLSSCLNRKTR